MGQRPASSNSNPGRMKSLAQQEVQKRASDSFFGMFRTCDCGTTCVPSRPPSAVFSLSVSSLGSAATISRCFLESFTVLRNMTPRLRSP